MDIVTYSGNGGTQSIDGLDFSPDLVWVKNRDDSAQGDHRLYDTIRGATKELYSNYTNAEATDPEGLSSFTSDGFTVGNLNAVNGSGDEIVAWCWDAGDTTQEIAAGSLNSSVYNQSQTWSTVGTVTGTAYTAVSGADRAFDGTVVSVDGAAFAAESTFLKYVFTPPLPFTNARSFMSAHGGQCVFTACEADAFIDSSSTGVVHD